MRYACHLDRNVMFSFHTLQTPHTGVQSQKAVTAYFSSKRLLPLSFAEQRRRRFPTFTVDLNGPNDLVMDREYALHCPSATLCHQQSLTGERTQ